MPSTNRLTNGFRELGYQVALAFASVLNIPRLRMRLRPRLTLRLRLRLRLSLGLRLRLRQGLRLLLSEYASLG